MKKALIIIGSIGVLYVFASFILPKIIAIPFAAYNSKKVWTDYEKEYSESKTSELVLDSIGSFPFPIGSVSDYEKIFNENQISNLTKIISDYEQKTTREIAIVTVNSIEPYENIADYSTDLANEWGIGNPESDNGLLILFSKSLRELRITTGFGTEKILTDKKCKKVIDETIIPEFKNGDYYNGIEKGLSQLIKLWE
ncbi:TPM domain-containing protein [Thalassobellus sediminis]|uniref:TPM domain-containing protein n=1 Tax=Thalassobellus sediminis TaxID=3367753 RepID=UPI0037967BF2